VAITPNGLATSTGNSTAANTLVIGKPSGLLDGDVLVATVTIGSSTDTVTAPAGWVTVPGPTWPLTLAAATVRMYAYYKPITNAAGEPSTYTFNITAVIKSGGGIQAYTGTDPTTPWDVNAVTATSTTPCVVGGITTVTDGCLLISGGGGDADTSATLTVPASMTSEFQAAGKRTAQAHETQTAFGPTGTRTWTISAALSVGAWLGALRPAPAASSQSPKLPPHLLLPLVARAQAAWQNGPPAQTDYTATQTDDTGLTDTTATSIEQTQTDSTGLTDTSSVQVVKDITQTDSTGLTDTVEKTISQAQTDSAGLTDTTAAALTKTQTDSAGLTDTATVELSKLLTQTDDAGLTDSVIRTIAQAATDTAGLTDTTSLSRSAAQTDSTGLTDTSTVVSAKSVDQTDSAGLTDAFALRRDLAPTDSTGLTDNTTIGPFSKTQTDSAGLTDSATTVLGSPFTPAYVSIDASTSSGGLDSAATATTTDAGTTGTNLDTQAYSGAMDTTTVATGMIDA
jgi:hypothetical protein